jgi:CspA family cold shock protein
LKINQQAYLTKTMNKGKIARLTDRGFGFISQDGEEKDLFFHASELQGVEFNELKDGDAVTFEVKDGPKGPNAVNVALA